MRKNRSVRDLQAVGPPCAVSHLREPVAATSIECATVYEEEGRGTNDVHEGDSVASMPSLRSSNSISSLAPLSKLFSLPSRPSMRRLVPSPSMPSLRIDLRRERSSSDLREDAYKNTKLASSFSSSPSSSSRAPTIQYKTASDHRAAPCSFNCPPVASSPTFAPRSGNTATFAKLQGARQMLMHSAKRRVTGSTGRAASHTSTLSIASTASEVNESPRSKQTECSSLSTQVDMKEASSNSVISHETDRSDFAPLAQIRLVSPPIAERILPPDEMIATIDRMRNARQTHANSGLGLTGVNMQQSSDVMQRCRSPRDPESAERNVHATDCTWASSSYASPSSPSWAQHDVTRSPSMTPFSSSGSSGRGTSVGMTSVDSFCTSTVPSSPVQRSLPVPPRASKKPRSHAQSLPIACNVVGRDRQTASPTFRSTDLTRGTPPMSDSAAAPTSPLTECAEPSTHIIRRASRGALASLPYNTPPPKAVTLANEGPLKNVKAVDVQERTSNEFTSASYGPDKENDSNRTPVRTSIRNSFSIDPSTPLQQTLTSSSSANSFGVRRRTPDRRSSVVRTNATQWERSIAIHRLSVAE